MSDATGFHAGDGWFFKRLDDEMIVSQDAVVSGRVEIRHDSGSIIFDKDTWASIVASVSSYGENGDTFEHASALHNGLVEFTEGASYYHKPTEASDA